MSVEHVDVSVTEPVVAEIGSEQWLSDHVTAIQKVLSPEAFALFVNMDPLMHQKVLTHSYLNLLDDPEPEDWPLARLYADYFIHGGNVKELAIKHGVALETLKQHAAIMPDLIGQYFRKRGHVVGMFSVKDEFTIVYPAETPDNTVAFPTAPPVEDTPQDNAVEVPAPAIQPLKRDMIREQFPLSNYLPKANSDHVPAVSLNLWRLAVDSRPTPLHDVQRAVDVMFGKAIESGQLNGGQAALLQGRLFDRDNIRPLSDDDRDTLGYVNSLLVALDEYPQSRLHQASAITRYMHQFTTVRDDGEAMTIAEITDNANRNVRPRDRASQTVIARKIAGGLSVLFEDLRK